MSDGDDDAFYGLDVFELYHLIQENPSSPSSRDGGPMLPALGHATAGAIASALTKTLVYPIEIVVTRLQVQKQLKGDKETPSAASDADAEYKSLLDAARKIYRDEGGIPPFYTGCDSDVVKGIIDSFLFFLSYQVIRSYLQSTSNSKSLPVFKELSVGVLAGCISKSVTTPIQNIVTRQQTAALVAARNPTSEAGRRAGRLTVTDIAKQIRAERGLAGFWSGYSAAIILTLNPAITFAVENFLRRLIPKDRRKSPPAALTFLLAAMSKVVATTITYPISLAKSQAQASSGSSKSRSGEKAARADGRRPSPLLRVVEGQIKIFKSLQTIYRSEGVGGLYSGLEGEVVKGFIQHGLTMLIKDRVHGGVIGVYYALLKLTRQWPHPVDAAAKELPVSPSNMVSNAENVAAVTVDRMSELAKKVTGNE